MYGFGYISFCGVDKASKNSLIGFGYVSTLYRVLQNHDSSNHCYDKAVLLWSRLLPTTLLFLPNKEWSWVSGLQALLQNPVSQMYYTRKKYS